MMDFEVGVAIEMVGQEADGDLEGDELAGNHERVSLRRREKGAGGAQVAAGRSFKGQLYTWRTSRV